MLGLSGIAVLFLPFAVGISPLEYLLDHGLFNPQLPFPFGSFFEGSVLLPVPISVATLLLLVSQRPLPLIWIAAYSFGFGGAGLWLVSAMLSLSTNWHWGSFLICLISVAILFCGGVLVARNRRRGVAHAQNAISAMQVACVQIAVWHLILFVNWDAGAYVAIFTIAVYFAHVVLAQELTRRANCMGMLRRNSATALADETPICCTTARAVCGLSQHPPTY